MKSVERELSAPIEVKEHTGSAAVLSVSRTHSGWHGAASPSREKAHRVCCCAEAKPHTMAGTVLRHRAKKEHTALHPELRSSGKMFSRRCAATCQPPRAAQPQRGSRPVVPHTTAGTMLRHRAKKEHSALHPELRSSGKMFSRRCATTCQPPRAAEPQRGG